VRDLRFSPEVAGLLGPRLMDWLRREPMFAPVRCVGCKAEANLDSGVAMSVLLLPHASGVDVRYGHASCCASRLMPREPCLIHQQMPPYSELHELLTRLDGAPPILSVAAVGPRSVDLGGGERRDLLLSALLARGLVIVSRIDGPTLARLPVLTGWTARPHLSAGTVQIRSGDDELIYEAPPSDTLPGWLGHLVPGQNLALLVSSVTAGDAPAEADLEGVISATLSAAGDARTVGGLVPVALPSIEPMID